MNDILVRQDYAVSSFGPMLKGQASCVECLPLVHEKRLRNVALYDAPNPFLCTLYLKNKMFKP